ncbi:hypothetical protein COLO4_25476 [Corchorus olitorius]|uniref:Uncharacterized protein n=1 Tax=Corchorus olitorius TaxID=93759 RepID=A0A1R3I2D5_9ROSI|nr:hypothetical protein COLO4_25476 [Corchorus olitorius]
MANCFGHRRNRHLTCTDGFRALLQKAGERVDPGLLFFKVKIVVHMCGELELWELAEGIFFRFAKQS